ncbi:MAG TPA: hypothetical protein PLG95_06270, partial [Methanoculleus sp.]|nr:hypothetical protein [Methanoculleus sp.]
MFQFNRPYPMHASVKPSASRYPIQIEGSGMPNITNHLPVTGKTVTLHGNSAKRPVPYLNIKKNAFCTC